MFFFGGGSRCDEVSVPQGRGFHPSIEGRYAQMGDGVLHAKVAMEIAGPPGNVTFLRSEAAVKAGLPVLKWGRIWHGHLSMDTWLHQTKKSVEILEGSNFCELGSDKFRLVDVECESDVMVWGFLAVTG